MQLFTITGMCCEALLIAACLIYVQMHYFAAQKFGI